MPILSITQKAIVHRFVVCILGSYNYMSINECIAGVDLHKFHKSVADLGGVRRVGANAVGC